jgi:hypothetical protein
VRTVWVYSIKSLVATFIFFWNYLRISLRRLWKWFDLWILSMKSLYFFITSRWCMFLTLLISFLCCINKPLRSICSSISICTYHCTLNTSLTAIGISLSDFVKHCPTFFSVSSDLTEESSIYLFKSHYILSR